MQLLCSRQYKVKQFICYCLTREMFPVEFSVFSKQEMQLNAPVLHFTQMLYDEKYMKT